jgi:hypothetical protein
MTTRSSNGMTELSRRRLLGTGAAALAMSVLPAVDRSARAEEAVCGFEPSRFDADPKIAVSLGQLIASLHECKSTSKTFSRARCSRIRRLGGMTRLDGFVADPATRDIVLWGQKEPDAPPLYLDDFVIAMRAAMGRYIGKPGDPGYNLAPGISIDPDPEVYRRLRAIDVDAPDFDRRIEEVCASPQKVRVDGMPRHTRVSYVLVDADYRMKQVGQGTMKLPIDSPFPSHTEVSRTYSRIARQRGTTLGPTNTRFWFAPGRFDYQVTPAADAGFLETAQVVLQDEDEKLTHDGLAASGAVNPMTRAFTCAWTERMEDTYRAEPIWRDMHNIFRHFALARIIVRHGVLEAVRFQVREHLDAYVVQPVKLWDTLPGKSLVYRDDSYTSWVCGGVSLGFDEASSQRRVTGSGDAAAKVMARRPQRGAVSWDVG